MAAKLHIYNAPDTLYRRCAERILELARATLEEQANFHIALAGGSTPRALYHELAQYSADDFPYWERVRFYFGDERSVPADHPQSNYRMARESLFQPLSIHDTAIARIPGELEPEQAVAHYTEQLQKLPKSGNRPRFDLVLLGMGPDGHVASLFPGSPLLAEQHKEVGADWVDKLDSWRYSLTLPVINNARHIILLVSGAKKADVVRHIFHRRTDAEPLPVERLEPKRLEWYLDAEAARFLDPQQEE